MPGAYLFTGKGGAGKTTCAAAFALALGSRGRKVLLVSLDPAHNLGDILDRPLGPEPLEVEKNILAMEADLEKVMEERILRARRLLEDRYRYLSVASMEPLLSILGKAPGVEEQAGAEILMNLRERAEAKGEVLVVDLPPSGQAWRLLSLPALHHRWARSLLELRKKVLDRRKTLFHVLGEETPAREPGGGPLPVEAGADSVAVRLEEILERNQSLADLLADSSRAQVVGVTLSSRLSLLETARLEAHLGEWGIPLTGLVMNRADPDHPPSVGPYLSREPDVILPELPGEPRGRAGLEPLGEAIETLFEG